MAAVLVDGVAVAALAVTLAVPLAGAVVVALAVADGVGEASAALPLAMAARFSSVTVADSRVLSWPVTCASWLFSVISFFRSTRAVLT